MRQPDFAKAVRNLERNHRDELILTIQSYSQDPDSIESEVAQCIKDAGISYFDFLLLGSRNEFPGPRFIEVFERMKSLGMVRFLSVSSHNRPSLQTYLTDYSSDECPYEILMLRYNAVHRGAERDVFAYVKEKSPTILTYTATRWGHLLAPSKMPNGEAPVSAKDCYRFSLSHPAVDMVLCGPASEERLDQAMSALEAGPLAADERARLELIGEHLYKQYAPTYVDQGDADDVAAGLAANPVAS